MIENYLPYWSVIAASLLFLALGLWWRFYAAHAMERTPRSASWVKNYRTGGFPFHKALPAKPQLRPWMLLAAVVTAIGLAVGRLANMGMIYLRLPEVFFGTRYGVLLMLMRVIGAAAVYCLLNTLFDSMWVSLPGALIFSASAARGHTESCLLAVSLLLLLLWLRAQRSGFPAELLYLAAILVLAPLIAFRQSMVWLLLCLPLVHWYKLRIQRRAAQLSNWQLVLALLAALAAWALFVVLAAALRQFQFSEFRLGRLFSALAPSRIPRMIGQLLDDLPATLFQAPSPGMTIDLMVDAPLLGFGLWGCWSAWSLARQPRDARGIFILSVLAVLLLVWLLTGAYALSLGLVLTAACILRDADIGAKRTSIVLMTLAVLVWTVLIQVAAWYVPLTEGLLERLI